MDDKWKRILSVILFALLLGLPGCGMALGDLTRGRSILDWIFLGAIYFLFAGLLLGLVDAQYWYLSAAAAWGPIVVGTAVLIFPIGQRSFMEANVVLPVLFALVGGFIGSTARAKIGAK